MTYEQIHHLFKHAYHRADWKNFLAHTFTHAQLLANPEPLTQLDPHVAANACKLGYIVLYENGIQRHIAVYEVALQSGIVLERNRVGLRNLLRPYWKNIDAAFIVFYNPDSPKWRFSYVSELTGFDAEGNFQKIQTEPKRFTYVLGEGESARTAAQRFALLAQKAHNASLNDVKDTFSVEKLSKEFFTEYKKHYDQFCLYLSQQPAAFHSIFNSNEKAVRDFVKKLLGRIVFLYFLQKKGWLGVPINAKWGEGDFDFLTKLFRQYPNPDLFYTEVLTRLFFDTLNTNRPNDTVQLLPPQQPCRIPYLNGGLFEPENPKTQQLIIAGNLFDNLFQFFNQYNFTIYEDDPNDHTVAVDPEMLGHIFENLLEDNKDKGAFYTPKEIVHFMCQQSLIEYLTTWFQNKGYQIVTHTSIGKENSPLLFPINEGRKGQMEIEIPSATTDNTPQIDRQLIEKLLQKKLDQSDTQLIKLYLPQFHQALDSVKICDPAIGSGAFPMGLLQEIFTTKQTLWFFEHGNLLHFPASQVKRNIIQNSIYGVDIEKGAVDIARLRFWLSLIVDEETPKPLPNLDYKIVTGNSLLSKLGKEVITIDWLINQTANGLFAAELESQKADLLNKINQAQKAFFDPHSHKKTLAADIRNLKIDLLITQLQLMIKTKGLEILPTRTDKNLPKQTELYLQTIGWKNAIKDLQQLKTKPDIPLNFFDWKLDFPEVMNEALTTPAGFDIVIGNPPYIQLQKDGGKLAQEYENQHFQTFERTGDIYSLFYEKGINLLKPNGHLCFITSNKWMRAGYGKSTRAFFLQYYPKKLLDLGSGIFESATVDTNILLIQKAPYQAPCLAADLSKTKNIPELANTQYLALQQLTPDTWTIANPIEQQIRAKIQALGKPLKDWDIQINYGIKTGYNEAFIINSQQRAQIIANCHTETERLNTQALIKPLLRGRDIKRYYAQWQDLWLIATFPALKLNIDEYPAIKNYLLSFGKKLHQTGEEFIDENGQKQKTRKKTGNKWFETQDQIGYYQDFEKEKIIYPNMTLFLPFIYDEKGFYTNQKCFIITSNSTNLKYLIGYFNSKVSHRWIRQNCPELQGGTRELSKIFFQNIPIPHISAAMQRPIVALVEQIIACKERQEDSTALEQQIDLLVYKLYGLTYEEVLVIDPQFWLSRQAYEAVQYG